MPNIDIQGKSVSLELAFNLPPKRAVEYLQAKGVEINFDWETASDEAKARAFTAAGVYRLDILSDMKELVTQAVEKGTPYNEFKTQMLSALASKGYIAKNEGLAPYRLKNIYRQNIQNAYQAGSYKDLDESKKYLPYWKYIAIDDARTTTVCRLLNKTILPADDPFWNKHFPPNHHGCRSNVIGMTKAQAMKEGITPSSRRDSIMESNPPAKGFDYNPGKAALWDKNGGRYTCLDVAEFAEDRDCISPAKNQNDYNFYGRKDVRHLSDNYFLEQPKLLQAGKTIEDAEKILVDAFGLSLAKPLIAVQSPIEPVYISIERLNHVALKRQDARERYANYIIPTIENPFEVYFTLFEDGSIRPQYIGLFKGKNNLLCSVKINNDSSILWNIMQANNKKINDHRIGYLMWKKEL